jgi:ATP-dependent protease HslVU (ClpYQ) peptidase subunit
LTIIVAVEHQDGVVVACDSQVTDSGASFQLHTTQNKIGVNGPYIIGAAGRLRTGQVLLHADDLPVPDGILSEVELNRFMINKFSVAAQEAMKVAGCETTMDSERLLTESELVVCIQGRAFMMGEDYSVMRASNGLGRVNGIGIAGSGWKFAMGAYHGLMQERPSITAEELAHALVESAIYWDEGCGGTVFGLYQQRP